MSRKVQDIKRPEIVKLARTPYTNYEAFLASVEDWLMPDEGVFEFFVSGRVLETPLEAVRKLMSDRESSSSSSSSSSTGVTTRSMTMDPLLSMYYQSEINKIQKKYED
jgi:elongation factor P hydroxylase